MKTYILFWGPAFMWYNLNEVAYGIEDGMCGEFAHNRSWPVTGDLDIKKGDRFFIFCSETSIPKDSQIYDYLRHMGTKFYPLDGICFGGFFTSDLYEEDDEKLIDIEFDFAVLPGLFPTINTENLDDAIPDVDWYQVDGELLIEDDNERKFIELISNWMKSSGMEDSSFTNFTDRDLKLAYTNLFGAKV